MRSITSLKFKKNTPIHIRAYCSPPYKVLFFGCDKVALESLKALYKEKVNNADLISRLEVVLSKKFQQCRKNIEEVNIYHFLALIWLGSRILRKKRNKNTSVVQAIYSRQ